MHKPILSLTAALLLTFSLGLGIGCARRQEAPSIGQGPDISAEYVRQARLYRQEGRYDLARQSYAQALSTCRSNANLAIIERELAGTELLIRTMR